MFLAYDIATHIIGGIAFLFFKAVPGGYTGRDFVTDPAAVTEGLVVVGLITSGDYVDLLEAREDEDSFQRDLKKVNFSDLNLLCTDTNRTFYRFSGICKS